MSSIEMSAEMTYQLHPVCLYISVFDDVRGGRLDDLCVVFLESEDSYIVELEVRSILDSSPPFPLTSNRKFILTDRTDPCRWYLFMYYTVKARRKISKNDGLSIVKVTINIEFLARVHFTTWVIRDSDFFNFFISSMFLCAEK